MRAKPGEALGRRIPQLLRAWRGPVAGSTTLSGPLSLAETRTVASSLLRLQRGLTGERSLVGEPYMDDRGLLGAYLLYYWPVSYLQTALALEELFRPASGNPLLSPSSGLPGIRRVLDIGSGPGPASAAFLDRGAVDFTLVDSGRKALELAEKLLAAGSASGEKGSRHAEGKQEPRLSVVTIRTDIEAMREWPSGPFDAIVLSHSLNELWRSDESREEKRLAFLGKLLFLLAEGGILLVVEPALLSTSRELLGLRDRLLSEHPGLGLAGPCPASLPCPALAAGPGRSCHSEYSWQAPEPVASLAAAAGLDRSSVKACWLAFRKNFHPGSAVPAPNSIEGRIVSEAMLNKAGRIRYIVCVGTKLVTVSAGGKDDHARDAGFTRLGRGDCVLFEGLEPRGEGDRMGPEPGFLPASGPDRQSAASFGFGAGSSLLVTAPAPKP